ncbi:MAG TPA: hypothetical protein VG013_36575 [Gemmataceae bacterium]|nr:hypothetical protein [Gemmataceae bacterium]
MDTAGRPPAGRQRYRAQLAQAAKDLRARPDDPQALYRHAQACFRLGRDLEAVAGLSALIQGAPSAQAYQLRALACARLGRAADAGKDVAAFRRLSNSASSQTSLAAMVAAYLGQDMTAFGRLETALAEHPGDTGFLYEAARAYAVAAHALHVRAVMAAGWPLHPPAPFGWAVPVVIPPLYPGQARPYADRAVALLQQAVETGRVSYLQMEGEPDLEALRADPGLAELLAAGHLGRAYSAVWHQNPQSVSEECHGLDPAAHLERCRELAAQGYRPAAVSLVRTADGPTPATAFVWHRPVVPEADRDALARRQARAAVTLLQLGQAERVWPLLRQGPDPRLRSYLIHSLAPLRAEARGLGRRLREETDVSVRRAPVLAFGEFADEDLPNRERRVLTESLLAAYNEDPDPGVHSAVDWLLRRWHHGDKLVDIDREWKATRAVGGRRWYVNGQGQTFAVVGDPGEFWMGSPGYEPDRVSDEVMHRKRLGRRSPRRSRRKRRPRPTSSTPT